MKKIVSISFIVLLLILFTVFEYYRNLDKLVLKVVEPAIINIDLNNNKIFDAGETVCLADINSFTSNLLSDKDELAKSMNLSKKEALSVGYFADEFAQKTLENKRVKLKFTDKQDQNCRYANIFINNENYADLLTNAGFAIKDGKPLNPEKFNKILNKAKKSKFVILNHSSNKYHKLDCKYGLIAHDAIIIFAKQLPKDAKPCKYCHIKKKRVKSDKNIHAVKNIPNYPTYITNGSIKLYLTDFTTKFKPDNKCNSNVCKEVLNQINNSTSTIDIAIYGWDYNPTLENALTKAKERGVTIRLVYDDSLGTENYYPATKNLVKIANISKSDVSSSKTESAMLMHNKFMIFDRQKLITGSMNFSNTGLSGFNANSFLLINSKEISELYTKEFEQMLSGKFHKNKIKLQTNTYILGNSKITPLFSPKEKPVTNNIIPLISRAKNSIYIPAFLVTHSGMIDSLISAKQRGVDIKIIIDATSYGRNSSKIKKMRSSGILLKVENYAGKMHSKTIIIDNKYVITGSMNFSYAGENKNDENCLIIEDKRLAKFYAGYFDYIWKKIPDKYLKQGVRAEGKYSIGSCSDGVDNNFDGKIDLEDAGCK